MCKVPLSLSTFLSLSDVLQFIKIWTPRTTSCSGWPAAFNLAFSPYSLFDPSVCLGLQMCRLIPWRILRISKFTSSAQRQIPSPLAATFTLVRAVTSSAQWWLWAIFGCVWPFPSANVLFCSWSSPNTPVAVVYSTQQHHQGDCQITWLRP